MKKITCYLFNIPLIALSLLAINFTSVAFANSSQINNKNTSKTLLSQTFSCTVINIKSGQLALRFSPSTKSKAKAGLNNANTVALLANGSGTWAYVRVINGPNRRVNGLEGWVNSDFLSCYHN
jgi:Bacterial SH3 domain